MVLYAPSRTCGCRERDVVAKQRPIPQRQNSTARADSMAADETAAEGVDGEERHRLTALSGLAGLSLDALASVAYGPEAALLVLVAAGAAGVRYILPVSAAIVVLLAALVISYRQVIAAFPGGGSAYAVAREHLGKIASLVAAGSLVVDYVLNAAVSVSAGVEAVTAAFPALYASRVWLCLLALALLTAANLWGVGESAQLFIVPTLAFVAAMGVVIAVGLMRSHPAAAPSHHLVAATETVGFLLVLKAFGAGCSALTGVEAIANAVPEFRKPRVRRAQHTEMLLGIALGVMLIGLAVLIRKFDVGPQPATTVLAQVTAVSVGHGAAFYAIQLVTMALLVFAANTSFGGLPVLTSLLAADNYMPHVFHLRAEREVHRYGVMALTVAAAALLVGTLGNTQTLVPLFAVGVLVGFTLAQVGMVRHWHVARGRRWTRRALVNGGGALLSFAALVIVVVSKFTGGAWLVVLVVPLLVAMFSGIHRAYDRIGSSLQLDKMPSPPHGQRSLAIVPVTTLSKLTEEAISTALSLSDEVTAVTVRFEDPEDSEASEAFSRRWQQWQPDVPLVTLSTSHRSLGPPIAEYLHGIEVADTYHRLVVLIAEVQPTRPWQWILHNQRGIVLDRAIRRGTNDVVVCRLRLRLPT